MSLSSAAVTIDAGQSVTVSANVSGASNLSWNLTGTGCSGSICGTVSGSNGTATYVAPASVTSTMTVTLTAAISGTSNSKQVIITVNPDPTISANLPEGTVGVAYTGSLKAAGGTAPLTFNVNGEMPPGLSYNATSGAISGVPTATGTVTFTAQVVDSSSIPFTVTANESITIGSSTSGVNLAISGSPVAGTVGTPYATNLFATGGTGPYTFSVISGAPPAGLTLASTGIISGTPTTQGSGIFTAQVQDSAGSKATATFTIVINASSGTPVILTTTSLPNGMVGTPYSATIGVSGGTSPYSCSIVSGTLPAGLALGTGCAVTGTPTIAGTSLLSIKASDSSNPSASTTGTVSITITAATLTLSTSPLPGGTVGTPYSATIGVTGGTGPYTCISTGGSLPPGLSLGSDCVVSGTPTTAGTTTATVKVTDSSNPSQSVSGAETITIAPASLTLSMSTLPNGTVGTPYSATIGVSGGTSPYSCSVTSGSLPAGLTLGAACLVSGTPTVAGTVQVTVKATDSGNPAQSVSGPETITIAPAAPTLVIASPPAATVLIPYVGTIPVTGGTGPYSCVLNSGTLPTGLVFNANCTITGEPMAVASQVINVTATDSSHPAAKTTGFVTVTVNGILTTLTLSPPSDPTVGTPYTGTIGVNGGTGPYSCTISPTTPLPAGLTLGPNCTITGTATTAGTTTVTVTATDSGTPPGTVTGPVSITVLPVSPVTLTGSLPNATLGLPYTQTLQAAGGVGPYTYKITAGKLPAGLSLSTAGVISGTPTAVGASSFTVTASDSETVPETASLPLVLLVVYPITPNDPEFAGPYAYLFQGYDDAVLGVLAYQTASVGSFTADGAGGISGGEMDSNHQSSTAAGNTVASDAFLGTYTIGADNRGSLTITTINTDGTTGKTFTYAIALKAPVAPATVSVKADMIEADNDHLAGTKGSGTILAQTTSAFAAGLNGSYAFGLSGDTPCIPTCTINLPVAGPVAAVGEFAANGSGAITSGSSDANIGSTNYANSTLSGTYGSADGNGRLAFSMATSELPAAYPTDYAVYMVDASHAFVMSTDKHSAFVLLAGTAQQQTQATFTNASLTGPYVGYENAPTNPGLVGATLNNTLNLSSATIFQATAGGAGTCTTNQVDVGGLTGLVNGLTGLGSGSNILNAVLGTYATTGNSACTVASDGRGVLAYPKPTGLLALTLSLLGLGGNPPPPRVLYLVSPTQAYFLETGYAGLGELDAQTGGPFTLATLDGTYIYGSITASSVATINTSGVIVANGKGNATVTSDLNVGVGTLNILQLGVSSSFNYVLQNASEGRYTYGTDVIYAISPGKFVMLDEDPLTTAPSVTVLQ